MDTNYTILLTIDVEDWFQVENFKPWIPFSSWQNQELRVEKNIHRILDLLDSIEVSQRAESRTQKSEYRGQNTETRLQKTEIVGNSFADELKEPSIKSTETRIQNRTSSIQPFSLPASSPLAIKNEQSAMPASLNVKPIQMVRNDLGHDNRPKATFFTLTWIAERLPHLVREIQHRGHEIASHGCDHVLINQLSYNEVKNEMYRSKKILEDIIGVSVTGFRAPSFSIDDSILKIIEDTGYTYDSSYNSFKVHDRYGTLNLKHNSKKGGAVKVSENFFELPISNLNIMKFIIPWGGGAYFRLIPYFLFRLGIQNILKKEKAYTFYIHPWELDPEQPRVNQVSLFKKLRHYYDLKKTLSKLEKLIKNFSTCNYPTCSEYISQFSSE